MRTKTLLLLLGLALSAVAQTVDSIPFRVILSSRNVVPPATTQATGTATIWLRTVRDPSGAITSASADLTLRYQFPGQVTVTGLKFYRGAPGSLGELVFDTQLPRATDPAGTLGVYRRLSVPPNQAQLLIEGYRSISLSLETERSPNGALRGQLESPDYVVLLAPLTSGISPATGAGSVSLLATRDLRGRLTSAEVTLEASYSGTLNDSVPSSVQFKFGSTRFESSFYPIPGPNRFEIPIAPATADLVTALLRAPSQVTLAFTTNSDSLQGPLHGTDRATFSPPASNCSIVLYNLRDGTGRSTASLLLLDPPPNYKALEMAVGGISVMLRLSSPFSPILIQSHDELSIINELLISPEHSALDLLGDVPRPLAPTIGPPVAQSIISAVWDPRHRPIAPGGLFTVFGRNLAKVPGDLAGLIGNRVPTSLNGTSVLMAGRPVPIIDVRPDHIIAQVPTDMPPGPQPAIVRTSSGESAAVIASVTPTAPAVFFTANTPQGNVAAVYKANGTEVSMDNPARPGDTLLFFSSGFGARTTPPLATGLTAPDAPLLRTANPTVTIGGRPAPVLYSILAPGLIGIVQTAVRMPQSAGAGNIPFTVSLGPDRSNPTIIYAAMR